MIISKCQLQEWTLPAPPKSSAIWFSRILKRNEGKTTPNLCTQGHIMWLMSKKQRLFNLKVFDYFEPLHFLQFLSEIKPAEAALAAPAPEPDMDEM